MKMTARSVGRGVRRVGKALAIMLLLVLLLTFGAAVWGSVQSPVTRPLPPTTVNDVTALNPIVVADVIEPRTVEEIVQAVRTHSGPISIGGGRYSMGGQTATPGALQIDMRRFNRVIAFDSTAKTITVLIPPDKAKSGRAYRRLKLAVDDNSLIMLDQQPKKRMPFLWQCSNVSMVLLKKSDLFKLVIPSKIFECMAMQIPVVLGVEGESREIIEAAQSGLCIEPQNADELARCVARLADKPELCKELGQNGRRYVAEHFDRQMLAARYERLMARLANRGFAANIQD